MTVRPFIALGLAALLCSALASSTGSGSVPDVPPPGPPAGGDESGPDPNAEFTGMYERQGKPSTGPCPTGCKCYLKEEGCEIFTDCHGAGITGVPDNLDPKSDCVDLSQNGMVASENMFAKLPASLAYLELHGNKLGEGASLGGQFSRFTNLVHLGLEQNGLKDVPANLLASLKALKVVYLSHNEIESIAANAFADNSELRVLLLQHNKLASLPAGLFSGLQKLKVLKLVENPFTEVPEANSSHFAGLNLFQLDISEDNGDFYEDAMLEGLTNINELGNKAVDEEKVRKDTEQGRADGDMYFGEEAQEIPDDVADDVLDDETDDEQSGAPEDEDEEDGPDGNDANDADAPAGGKDL